MTSFDSNAYHARSNLFPPVTNDPSLDLAKLDSWCGVRPGMTRNEVQEIMRRRGIEVQEYGADSLTAVADDWEISFDFTTDGRERLRQMTVDGDAILWEGQPLIGLQLDDAWRLLGSPTNAVWQAADDQENTSAATDRDPATVLTDEELLDEGTMWLPERGLGLFIHQGEVLDVAWRAPQDLPARFDGPVTEAQRQLSKRPDLERHLDDWRSEQSKVEEKKDPLSLFRKSVTIIAIAALIMVGKKGFDEMRLWGDAPNLQAKFIAVENVPMKQFRDFLPPALRWLFPRGKPVMVEAYRVEFTTPEEVRPQQVVLDRGELYVPPENPGDEVPVAYVAGNPPRIKGLSRARDSAFVDYMPWAIAISLLWLAVHYLIGLLPAMFRIVPRLMKRMASSGVIQDPDRPELR